MSASDVVVFVVALLASAVLTEAARRLALRRGIVDRESARSSHVSVRPRGGGAAIVVSVPLAIAAGVLAGGLQPGWPSLIALAVATGLSIAGAADDVQGWSYKPKLLAQLTAAIVLVASIGPPAVFAVPGTASVISWPLSSPASMILTTLAVVAFINAFNFVDGIDAMAGLQALVGALVLAVAAMRVDHGVSQIPILALIGATAGFLLHNRPPARIFMGDVGSQYLGCLLAGFALVADRQQIMPASLALLVFLPLIADVVSTLIARIANGRRWHEAHRDHVYQQLVRRGWSHGRTSAAYGILSAASGAGILLCTRSSASSGWIWWALVVPMLAGIVGWRMSRTSRDMLTRASDTSP